jgi:hypothetical protein
MQEIKISRNKVAIVDDEDFSVLHRKNWSAWPTSSGSFYAIRHDGKKCEFMHHYIIGFPLFHNVVDHINHNGLDNRRDNLRIITKQQNSINRINPAVSGFPGVYKCRDKWQVKFTVNGTDIRCGTFENILEAIHVYVNTLKSYGKELLPEYELKYKRLEYFNCFKGY